MWIKPALSHSAQAVAEGALVALLIVGLMAGTAFAGGAGKGSTTSGSTLSLRILEDVNLNGSPNRGDRITFDVSTSATSMPMVGLRCYQGASFVHDGYIALYDASWLAKYFVLDSSYWDSTSSADCNARLFYFDRRGREKILATMTFGVAP